MTDKHPEAITVKLGGDDRTLKLSSGALRIAKLRHGVTFSGEEIGELGIDFVARLLWVAMLPDDPDLTEDAAALLYAQVGADEEDRIARYVLERFSDVNRRLSAITKEQLGKAQAQTAPTQSD